jgi:flagellar basal-body rod protein FlgB
MDVSRLLGSAALEAAENLVHFATARHKVIADNIANVDTPGYRMRDLSVQRFHQAISRALSAGRRANPNFPDLDSGSLDLPGDPDRARTGDAAGLRNIVFHDDNDRSIEKLVVTMTANVQRHNLALDLLRVQTRLLQAIVRERLT